MANFTKNSSKAKTNASLIKIVSPTSGKAIAWVNLTDSFAKSVLGKEPSEILKEEAETVLAKLVNVGVVFEVVDLTEEKEVVGVEDF
jgi:hypothetical protein